MILQCLEICGLLLMDNLATIHIIHDFCHNGFFSTLDACDNGEGLRFSTHFPLTFFWGGGI